VQDIIDIDPRIFQINFVLLKVELCLVVLIVLGDLSNSNFVVLRAALIPKLCNPALPPPVVLAALVVHALLYSFMQGIFEFVANF
jgi:hypothetical protein